MVYGTLSLISKAVSILPATFLCTAAKVSSVVLFDVLRLRRKMILRNLEIALSDERTSSERVQIGRKSVYNFILTVLECFRSHSEKLTTNIHIEGRDHVEAALAENRGVYILGCHLGNWEALGSAVNKLVAPCAITVKPVGGEKVNRFVEDTRELNGFRWIARLQYGDGVREIKESLKRKELVGFVYDQARPGEPRLPFFGKPAKTNTSLMALWHRHQAPILHAFAVRTGFNRHRVVFRPAIDIKPIRPPSESILKNSIILNQEIEQSIRQYPEQYFWFHNRWK